MNAQKTFDRQTAQLIAVIVQNLPTMTGDVMQGWIQNPLAVQKTLRAFAPPEITSPNEFAGVVDFIRCDADLEGISLSAFVVRLENQPSMKSGIANLVEVIQSPHRDFQLPKNARVIFGIGIYDDGTPKFLLVSGLSKGVGIRAREIKSNVVLTKRDYIAIVTQGREVL